MDRGSSIEFVKKTLREKDLPFFEDQEIEFYLDKNKNNVNDTIYECALVKAENTSLSIPGMNLPDTSSYFRRLAARYRPNNSRVLNSGC